MTFRPKAWFVGALSAVNIAGLGFALGTGEPVHASAHGLLALAFGFVAWRLGQRPDRERRAALEGQAGLEAIETEMDILRQELAEAQDRLEFAERMLAQGTESRRMDPDQP